MKSLEELEAEHRAAQTLREREQRKAAKIAKLGETVGRLTGGFGAALALHLNGPTERPRRGDGLYWVAAADGPWDSGTFVVVCGRQFASLNKCHGTDAANLEWLSGTPVGAVWPILLSRLETGAEAGKPGVYLAIDGKGTVTPVFSTGGDPDVFVPSEVPGVFAGVKVGTPTPLVTFDKASFAFTFERPEEPKTWAYEARTYAHAELTVDGKPLEMDATVTVEPAEDPFVRAVELLLTAGGRARVLGTARTLASLHEAMSAAHGPRWTPAQLDAMSAWELLLTLGPNGVIFRHEPEGDGGKR